METYSGVQKYIITPIRFRGRGYHVTNLTILLCKHIVRASVSYSLYPILHLTLFIKLLLHGS